MPEEKPPEEKAGEKSGAAEKEKASTETPGEKGEKTDDEKFLEIEGMGSVKVADVIALKKAQTGLERERNELRDKHAALEKKIQEIQDKDLSDDEKFRKEMEEERKSLLSDKIAIELEKAGISIDSSALNLGVEKLSEVSSAVKNFVEKYPGLVSKEEKKPGTETKPPAPAGGSPGETPPALDKEKEWLARLKVAEAKGDLAEVDKIKAEINAHRGRESSEVGAATL